MARQARLEAETARILREGSVVSPPIPVERIARDLGAHLTFEPFDRDMSGMLFRDGDRVIIGINSTHASVRQRFSIAHELGHLVLHEGRPMFVDRTVRINFRDRDAAHGTDQEEVEANNFAASLLMPREMLIGAMRRKVESKNHDSTLLIQRLADDFNVSPQAMEYRLVNLGLVSPG